MSPQLPDVVIPARYNETTIFPIVQTLRASRAVGRIIVPLDLDAPVAVIDALKLVIRDPQVKVMASYTCGKGQVVRAGLQAVRTDRVIFMDADVHGLTVRHCRILAERHDYPEMIIGVPDLPTEEELTGLPEGFTRTGVIRAWSLMSGFRSVPTDFVKSIGLHGYLMETQINQAARAAGFTVDYRMLRGLTSPLVLSARRVADMNCDREWGRGHGILPR